MATLYNSVNETAYFSTLFDTVPQIASIPYTDLNAIEAWQEAAWNSVLPAIEVADTAEGLIYTATLNGVAPQDVRVDVMQGYMSIRASFAAPAPYDKPVNSVEYIREFALPSQINEQNARISFHNNILTVIVPKAQRRFFGLF